MYGSNLKVINNIGRVLYTAPTHTHGFHLKPTSPVARTPTDRSLCSTRTGYNPP